MIEFSEPPRVELAHLPTPIDHLVALSEELDVQIYVKRDDLTGAALTGNKIRKLEYCLAEAMDQEADVLVTCGGAQSNHCRTTAVAARRLGLDVELFLRGAAEAEVEGNLFLSRLVGAKIHPLSGPEYAQRDLILARRAEELGAEGRRPYVIPEGASNALGSLGYVRCAHEIHQQAQDSGCHFDTIVCAVGSGGTFAGLLAGAQIHGLQGSLIGVPICDSAAHFEPITNTILRAIEATYAKGLDRKVAKEDFLDGHVGAGYGKTTTQEVEMLRDIAVLTGLILDPVYTTKAFGGLLGLIRDGRVAKGSSVLFIHTGGLFGLLPYQREFDGLESS